MNKKAQELAMHDKDTGSSEVQIALLNRENWNSLYTYKTIQKR